MKYYLGIDGGGTKTTYTVIDENKKVISITRSTGTAIDTYPIKDVKELLIQNIEALPYEFSGIFAGLGGIGSDEDIKLVNRILASAKNARRAKVGSNNDVANAHRGIIPDGNGIILIIGTGCAAYGVNGKLSHRAGGYGHWEGDSGSAYWLGKEAISYLARVMDGRFKESSFSQSLESVTKCNKWYHVAKYVMKADRFSIARLAMIVTSSSDNRHARELLDKGASEIKAMADAVYEKCQFKGKVKLGIVGSLGTADTYYKKAILNQLGTDKYEYVHGMHDAGLGAALLAKELK